MERHKHVVAIKKRDRSWVKFDDWQPIKHSLEAEYDALNKQRRLLELATEIQPEQMLPDIKYVKDDALKMYKFLKR
jgi:hypothetical protein